MLYVADGQNPHALGFMSLFPDGIVEKHLATTYPVVNPTQEFASISNIPFDFSAAMRASQKSNSYSSKRKSTLDSLRGSSLWKVAKALRDRTAVHAVPRQAQKLRSLINSIKPDLVHAFRLPYEGYMAGIACKGIEVPLLISTWGNDFTLYANKNESCAKFSRIAMARANGLHPDCLADYVRAVDFGFGAYLPFEVLPGNGGIDFAVFNPDARSESLSSTLGIPDDAILILNPRGWRSYVRNDVFWQAASIIADEFPNIYFAAVAMEGVSQAEAMVRSAGLSDRARLLPPLNRAEMAALFARAEITVSLSEHDGMPNSVIESMACGSYPVALDLPSLREVIRTKDNGDLIFFPNPKAIADAIREAVCDREKREHARRINLQKVADFGRERTGEKAMQLYEMILTGS